MADLLPGGVKIGFQRTKKVPQKSGRLEELFKSRLAEEAAAEALHRLLFHRGQPVKKCGTQLNVRQNGVQRKVYQADLLVAGGLHGDDLLKKQRSLNQWVFNEIFTSKELPFSFCTNDITRPPTMALHSIR